VVGVRVRPLTVSEQYGSQRSLIRVVDEQVLCFDPACGEDLHVGKPVRGPHKIGHRAAKDQKYAFDCVFDSNATQEEVYQKTARPQVESVLSGYNATVFAYGATGAGKTHTMIGDRVTGPGVMVLAMEDLFAAIESTALDSSFELQLTYLEVYNEQIRDLLAPEAQLNAPDACNGIHVAGLSKHSPKSSDEVLAMLQRGNGNRAMSATQANAVSSRSHAVLQITVRETAKTANVQANVRVGKLSLIDLAGSERASKTMNKGVRLHEGANI
ncbi:kinesin motor domain-containing protein, partial [Pavlovales sp. CCMP2436]